MAAGAAVRGEPAAAASPALTPPPGNPRFALFDSLRGIAVLGVLVFHVFLVSGALARRGTGDAATVLGSHGPILFFAISGFLLYRPWVAARASQAPPVGIARYARRRALRILPAYWVALTVLAIFPAVSGPFSDDWWRFYGLLQAYEQDTYDRGIPVAWTLCVEVTFYIALPLWALALRRLPARSPLRTELVALALLGAAGVLVQVAASRQAASQLVAQSLLGQSTWFALGMALAVASVAAQRDGSALARAVGTRQGLCWIGAAACFAALVALRYDTGGLLGIVAELYSVRPVAKTLAELALTAAMITLLLAPAIFAGKAAGLPRRVLSATPLAWLGLVSYGVYLWHLTIAELLALPAVPRQFSAGGLGLAERISVAPTATLLVLTLALSCLVAAASYYLVELPFLRRKER